MWTNHGDFAYLKNVSEPSKMILWQCQEKQISIKMTLADQ